MQSEKDLREKLLEHELQNLHDTMERLESLGVPLEMFDAIKKAVSKVTKAVTGTKDVQDVYNRLKSDFPKASINVTGDEVDITLNGKTVRVTCQGSKFHMTVDGATFVADNLNDLVTQIRVRTQPGTSAHMRQVMECSRAILQQRRPGF